MLKRTLVLASVLIITLAAHAQQTVTMTDAAEIKYAAKDLVIRDLELLMNFISNSTYQPVQIKTAIEECYSAGPGRIFDSLAIVEDDIDPTHTHLAPGSDRRINQYLRDLDATYKKSEDASIRFTFERTSNVKRSNNNLYVKVYFTSFFRNPSRTVEAQYNVNYRVAEVHVRKQNNRWVPTITTVRFFQPQDTVNDVQNDVVLQRDPGYESLDSATLANRARTHEQELMEKRRAESIKRDNEINTAYDKLISEGDKLRDVKDYTGALDKFAKAKELKLYDPVAYARINEVNQLKEKAKLTSAQLFEEFVDKARLMKNRREFKLALENYRNAKNANASRAGEIAQEEKDLTEMYSNVSRMEEMYKLGQYKEAIKEYTALLKKKLEYSDYFMGRGKCYEATNEPGKALADYTKAIEKDDDNVAAWMLRADLYKRRSEFANAITDRNRAIFLDRGNPVNYLELVELRRANNQLRDAVRELEEGLQVESLQANADMYYQKGLLLKDLGLWKDAIADLTTVIKIDSSRALGYYHRGLSQLQLKQVENAALDFESARNKGIPEPLQNNIAAIAEEHFQAAAGSYSRKKIDSAMMHVNNAIAINPANATYRYYKGEYYTAQKKFNDAIRCYDQALERNNTYQEAFYKRGEAYFALGNFTSALENYKSAHSLNINDYMAVKGAGDSFFALKDFSNAAQQYENCIRIVNNMKNGPEWVLSKVYNSLGKSYYQVNNFEKSVSALRSAIRRDENFAEAYYNRGLSNYSWGQLDDAISDLGKAVFMEPNHPSWNYYLARAYYDNKKYTDAVTYFTAAVTRDSTNQFRDSRSRRGSSYYNLKDYPNALPDYQYAISASLDTTVAAFNYELGNIYLNLSKADSAIACFQTQYARDTTNGLVAYAMGAALLQKGKTDEALTWFEKALRSNMVSKRDMRRDKMLAAIIEDKRFKQLLSKF